MIELCSLFPEEIALWFSNQGYPGYHAKQLMEWIYKKSILDWDSMTNLSKTMRSILHSAFKLELLQLKTVEKSDDGQTYKFLWELQDGKWVESVLIYSGSRRTICLSSQVGCAARCAFCASGKQGFFRNLSSAEIVEQFIKTNQWLLQRGESLSHIVYMGMGEPFDNYEAVVRSIRVLIDPNLFHISQRRITVSTVGVIEGIERFSHEGLKVNLALSLHAPNQHIRQKIIPYSRKYPLEGIMLAMDNYAQTTKRDITYEYTLIEGINDRPQHAEELASLLDRRQCTVNLIPYNPIAGLRLKRPSKEAVHLFRKVLDERGIVNTCRYTKGDDIAAACGQLALKESVFPSALSLAMAQGSC